MDRTELLKVVDDTLDRQELINLLQQMLGFKSFSRTEGERELSNFLEDYLKRKGLNVDRQNVEDERNNIIASYIGKGGGRNLLFNGHIDVNPPAKGWTRDPFGGEIVDGYIYGIGAVNMKAGDAAFITALDTVINMGVQLSGNIILSLVVGELQGGIGTIRMLEKGTRADAFIVAEPTELNAIIEHMGMVHVKFRTVGKSCHVSSKEKGINAIEYMYKILEAIEKWNDAAGDKAFERMNIGSIKGGLTEQFYDWRPSLIADYCEAKCDFRIRSGWNAETLLDLLSKCISNLEELKDGLKVNADLVEAPLYYYMPPFKSSAEEQIVKTVMQNHKLVTGHPCKIADFAPFRYFASDASHLNSKGNMPGLVYGPGGMILSQADESLLIEDIVTAAKVYALSILQYCQ